MKMEWKPFGKRKQVVIQASQNIYEKKIRGKTFPYIGVRANAIITPKEALRFSEAIIRAVKYTKKGVEWHEKTKKN
jgi:hypothetical protein